MLLSGEATRIGDYHHALDLLGALRLCANVPGQFAISAALSGLNTIAPLTADGGRLYETRRAVIDACAASDHLELVAPQGALYAFPKVVGAAAQDFDDHRFALEMLELESVLVVPGSSFNLRDSRHFRVTLLPDAETTREVFRRIDHLLGRYAEANARRHVAVA
jgi:alanine-synthesizing transaminase